MGWSKCSCLRIITCGGGGGGGGGGGSVSDEDVDLAPPESKASSDKRRWSFRKRSCRHRVLSNTVTSQPVSVSYNQESPEATADDFHSTKIFSVPEKAFVKEAPLSSPVVDSEIVEPQVTDRNTTDTDHSVEDSVAIVIQAAIRGYFARRELLKHKNIVKLQAAVRGHLVRRQAIGTLRCIQAIVKMQALVRARQARQYVKESVVKDDETIRMDIERSALMGIGVSSIKPNKTYSTEKLLSHRFARQLLESTPKTKHIPIKCDSSRSDSAWKWLERWMVVTSSDKGQLQEQSFFQGCEEHVGNSKPSAYGATNEVPVADVFISSDLRLAPSESALPTEGEGNSASENSSAMEFQPPLSIPDNCVSPPANNDQDKFYLENNVLGTVPEYNAYIERVTENISDSLSGQISLESNATAQSVLNSISDIPESDGNNPKRSTKTASCEPLESEGRKFVFGTRKQCNSAFAAAKSKFEELSSANSVSRSINPSYQGTLPESKSDSPIPQVDYLAKTKTKDLTLTENFITHDPRNQKATSECGTEISISSTLDSPDRSEAGGEIVIELGSLGKGNYVINSSVSNASNVINMNVEANNYSLGSEVLRPHRLQEGDGNLANLIMPADALQVEEQLDEQTDMQTQLKKSIHLQIYMPSPEGTPRSHTTALESHGTPSSQVSVNPKKGKKDGNIPTQKQRSQLVGKQSPSNPNDDSGGGSGTENFPKDSKTTKRRNSFGMANPDHVDHEPRISSSDSLPSYMQATVSARAKAHAVISPKSSPDVHDKDNFPKKRHSLPISNRKEGSPPRMKRSTSQARQNPKGNNTYSPHNSAERRWQR